jgi:hypothetical protein
MSWFLLTIAAAMVVLYAVAVWALGCLVKGEHMFWGFYFQSLAAFAALAGMTVFMWRTYSGAHPMPPLVLFLYLVELWEFGYLADSRLERVRKRVGQGRHPTMP